MGMPTGDRMYIANRRSLSLHPGLTRAPLHRRHREARGASMGYAGWPRAVYPPAAPTVPGVPHSGTIELIKD